MGDNVRYYYPRKYTRKSPKWQRCFIGPYRVVRKLPPVNYVIQRSSKSKPFVVHADKLKKSYTTPASDWTTPECVVESGLAGTAVPPSPSVRQSEPRSSRRREPQSPRQPEAEPEEEIEYGEDEDVSQRPVRNRRPPTYLKGYACRAIGPQY